MDLSIYQVIKGPVLSTKAFRLSRSKKLVLDVDPSATKPQIRDALQKLFQIKALKINVVSRQGKRKKMRGVGSETQRVFRKRAIVTLSPDQSIETLNQMSATQVV